MCVGGVRELPAGESLDDVVAAMRFVLRRHESLRTRLELSASGPPRQVLASRGEITVELLDAGEDDPAEVAREAHDRYGRENFDHAHEWPVRLAVVHRAGKLTHAVVAYSHMATDGPGLNALTRDVLGNAGAGRDVPVSGTQPLDQARHQRSPAGQRQSETALRLWERQLRRIPPRRFARSRYPRSPRFWEVTFTSPAMYKALGPVAGRNRVGTSSVLLAAFAVALHRMTGTDPSAFQVMVSNRFRPGFADSVSPLSQGSLCVIDVAGATFDEVVARAESTAMKTYLNAYYDPAKLDELIDRVSGERGEALDLSCFFNDRRFTTPRPEALEVGVTTEEIRAALALTDLRWGHRYDRWSEKFFLHVDDVPDVIRLFACGDTHYVSPEEMEAGLRDMEAVIVEAAHESAPAAV